MAQSVQPSAAVPSPMYFSPEPKITNAITGLMYRSGTLEDSSEPTITAGTLPRISETVTPNSTWPKITAPSAAASVSGTAWVKSVPTSWLAPIVGYTNSNRMIISDPAPTEVIPTITPPTTPIAMLGTGLTAMLRITAVRGGPLTRSRTIRSAIALAPTSSAAPSAISTFV